MKEVRQGLKAGLLAGRHTAIPFVIDSMIVDASKEATKEGGIFLVLTDPTIYVRAAEDDSD